MDEQHSLHFVSPMIAKRFDKLEAENIRLTKRVKTLEQKHPSITEAQVKLWIKYAGLGEDA